VATELPSAAPIAECKLDLDSLRRQRDRYRHLGRSVELIELREDHLIVRFAGALDEALLREALAVEAECCPFYRLAYCPADRCLRVGVNRREQLPALDALAFAFGGVSGADAGG
jgi:hypothetical protein